MHVLRLVFRVTVATLALAVMGFAQTGSITGTATDKSGAVIQNADVNIVNLDTGIVHASKTGSTGAYSLTDLPVGRYSIEVTISGFKLFRVDEVVLTVAQVLTANAQLVPGAVTEEVQVNGSELPPVDLETAQVSNLVDSRQMRDLPLITRDPYSLVLLSPGTSQTNTPGLSGFTVNGSRDRNNNFLLDGVDNNDTSVPGIPDGILLANPDSTEEFRVITNSFNAEYGRNTGAIIDVVTKSGTNSFHGEAHEYGRWNSFGGARDWFNPRVDTQGIIHPMNPYVRNQFGFSFGGPIIQNKTFFFLNDEIQRFRTTLTNTSIVPSTAFSDAVSTGSGTFQYTNPQTGASALVDLNTVPNNGTPTILQQLGSSGVLPPAPEDPTMKKVLALFPKPTFDNGDGLTGTLQFPSSSQQNSYQTVAKIDHQFTQRESVSLRYGYDHLFDPNPVHADILPGNVGGYNEKAIAQGGAAHLTSTLTNTMINDFTFGWNKNYESFDCTGISLLDSPINDDRFGNGWDFNMGPWTNLGCTSLSSDGQWRKTGTTSYGNVLSMVRGGHTLKFGADFRDIGEQGSDSFYSRRQLYLTPFTDFGVSLLQGLPAGVDSVALEDAAAAYYGFVDEDFQGEFFDKNGVRQGTDNKHFRQHEYDWFGQDEWKARRNVTLSFGVRYQLDGVPYEENANFSNLLENPASPAPLTMSIVGPGTGKQLYNTDYSNVEPRLGISWDPWGNGKTAVRGAFGIFHDRAFGNLFGNARGNPPFEQDYIAYPLDTINGFYGGAINGSLALPSPPDTTPTPIIPDYNPVTGVGALRPIIFDTNFRNPENSSWNFGIQHEFPGNNVLDIAYVGSEGHHLFREIDGNPPVPSLVNSLVAYCSVPNPYNCTPDTVQKTNLYVGEELGVLPYDAVRSNALVEPYYQVSVGNSVYHSLQTKITHALSHGLQVQGSYTWAHAIDDAPDPLAPAAGNHSFPRNSRDLSEERSNSDYDVRQVAVINYFWEVPFGRGKGVLNNGVVGKIFEGWQFSGITTAETGHPFDVYSATDMERTGFSGRADLVGDPYAPGSNTPSSANGNRVWFSNPAAFSGRTDGSGAPLYDGPGTSGRNNFYGPGLVDFDLVWSKKTKFGERVGSELRVECYNLFNHPHFINPDNSITSPTFGQILGTVIRPDETTSARQMQVALRVSF